MNARKIANAIGVFFSFITSVPLLAAAILAYNETDD